MTRPDVTPAFWRAFSVAGDVIRAPVREGSRSGARPTPAFWRAFSVAGDVIRAPVREGSRSGARFPSRAT